MLSLIYYMTEVLNLDLNTGGNVEAILMSLATTSKMEINYGKRTNNTTQGP